MAPPTNLPLSLLWESLVIAIGLNPAAAHLCERGVDTEVYSFPRVAYQTFRGPPLLSTDGEGERAGSGPGTGRQGSSSLFFFFFFLLLHISFLLNSPECSHGSYLSSRLVRVLPQR